MKFNRSGFAAKEFLAVIIIVCMLIVVLVPTILGIIKTSNHKILMDNVMIFRKEIDNILLSYSSGGNEVADGCYYVMMNGNVCLGDYDSKQHKCLTETLNVELSGKKPNAGAVDIARNKVVDIHNIVIDNLYVNVDHNYEYYISEKPKTQALCRP